MGGRRLLENLALLTGLPFEAINRELIKIVTESGKSPDEVTIEDTRAILANYLQDVLLDAKREFSENFAE